MNQRARRSDVVDARSAFRSAAHRASAGAIGSAIPLLAAILACAPRRAEAPPLPHSARPSHLDGRVFGTGHWESKEFDLAVEVAPLLLDNDGQSDGRVILSTGSWPPRDKRGSPGAFALDVTPDLPRRGEFYDIRSHLEMRRRNHLSHGHPVSAVTEDVLPGLGVKGLSLTASPGPYAYKMFLGYQKRCFVHFVVEGQPASRLDEQLEAALRAIHPLSGGDWSPERCEKD